MPWLRNLGRSALRQTGQVLAVHIVPDTLIPSRGTQKAFKTASSALSRPFSRSAKSTSKKSSRQTGASTGRAKMPPVPRRSSPARAPGAQKFNKNAWGRGAGLLPASGYSSPPPTSRSAPGPRGVSFMSRLGQQFRPSTVARRKQQMRDFRNEPRLVVQMKLDELFHSMRHYKPTHKTKHPY